MTTCDLLVLTSQINVDTIYIVDYIMFSVWFCIRYCIHMKSNISSGTSKLDYILPALPVSFLPVSVLPVSFLPVSFYLLVLTFIPAR